MEEKLKFVLEYLEQEWSMSELCERYGIARETGYVWLRRYQAMGWEGLREKSRAAQRYPNQTAEEIEEKVLGLRVDTRLRCPWLLLLLDRACRCSLGCEENK